MGYSNYIPIEPTGYQAITATSAATTGLTIPTPGLNQTMSNYAFMVCEANSGRWRDDGVSPTPTVGTLLTAGQSMQYDGELADFVFIGTSNLSTALSVNYYRAGG